MVINCGYERVLRVVSYWVGEVSSARASQSSHDSARTSHFHRNGLLICKANDINIGFCSKGEVLSAALW